MAPETHGAPAAGDDGGRRQAEAALVDHLREEASDVKECFNSFSFQAIAFTAALLSVIAKFQAEEPRVALAALVVVVLLLAVARIGIYKYGTANRNFGYELHLSRTRHLNEGPEGGWRHAMREIGWEEAIRAWRVVQATCYAELFSKSKLWPTYLKRRYRAERGKGGLWFEPKTLIVGEAAYYAGSYLQTMLGVLHLLSVLALSPLLAMALQFQYRGQREAYHVSLALLVASFVVVCQQMLWVRSRRRLLEEGFHSIHSSAVMWQAVVLAHYRAASAVLGGNSGRSLAGYTRRLSEEALHLKRNLLAIHEWVHDPASPSLEPHRSAEEAANRAR
jgi:hypothetical protein